MNVLRTISGTAVLTMSSGEEVEGFATLVISQRGRLKSGDGTFTCDGPAAFRAIKSQTPLTLTFAEGVIAKIIVTRAGMDGMEFKSTGPVEGL